jgi:hypothetical protein
MLIFVGISVLAIILLEMTRRDMFTVPEARRFAALEAIEEGVQRATEMGKPVHVNIGVKASLQGSESPQTLAAIATLGYTTRLAAKTGAPVIVSIARQETIPVVTETMRQAYLEEGKLGDFNPAYSIRWFTEDTRAFLTGCTSIINNDHPAATISIGPIGGEQNYIEVANRDGAMTIGGTARMSTISGLVVKLQYSVIGEEVMNVGAVLSGDKLQLSTIFAQDLAKYFGIAMLLLGSILATSEIGWLKDIFKL